MGKVFGTRNQFQKKKKKIMGKVGQGKNSSRVYTHVLFSPFPAQLIKACSHAGNSEPSETYTLCFVSSHIAQVEEDSPVGRVRLLRVPRDAGAPCT